MDGIKNSNIPWVGDIPKHWNLIHNKYLFDCGKEIVGSLSNSTQLLSLTTKGVVRKSQDITGGKIPESYDTYQLVEENNIVLCLFDLDCSAVFSGISKFQGMISPAYKVVSCRDGILPRYADYWFKYIFDGRKYKHYSKNLRFTLSYDEFGALTSILPPIAEQQCIIDFLDRKCADIDNVLEKTKVSIEKYKKLKQSVITEAVTKGIRGERRMKESGIPWIGQIPETWQCYRITNLYEERSESGNPSLPILTVSINTGVSDHEIADEDCDRVFVRSEDRTKYKRVHPSDLAYNMMRAWQGAFGAVRVDGMVSPAYVVAKPKYDGMIDSRYIEALLRTPSAVEEMHRYSHGIADFRLRLYWPEFKNIRICVPPIEEQIEIADYIDEKASSIDALISSKELFIMELEAYRKSLIYEYVTGKKEVSA